MMHRCCSSSSHGHVMGTCTCGTFHTQPSNSFSMLFSVPQNHRPYDDYDYEPNMYSFNSSPSSVDCTLSLGTPSTRLTEDEERRSRHEHRSSVSNYCWDLLQSKHAPQTQNKSSRSGSNSNNNNNNNDPLLARRCANCDTTSTPLWRNGPRGPKSLCNACGIRFKKEERRASAAAATSAAAAGGVMESSHVYGHHNNSWYAQSQRMMMGNELRFVDETEREDTENGMAFMSWRLNVADRSLLS